MAGFTNAVFNFLHSPLPHQGPHPRFPWRTARGAGPSDGLLPFYFIQTKVTKSFHFFYLPIRTN